MSDRIRWIHPAQAPDEVISDEERERRATWDGYVDEDESPDVTEQREGQDA